MKKYRNDIDGLRAIAVIAVILFHLGFLPNGYLGVDVFFAISGFLITSIIYREMQENRFSVLNFYERRVRRIVPLLLTVTSIALLLGLWLMLPDDLENLAQSVVASNCSANNILMLITSKNYWAIKNEYKPLMHTWSLGIEEQYYLIYPLLFLLLARFKKNYFKNALLILCLLSLALFAFWGTPATHFYLIQYRFFELAIGGLGAVYFFKVQRLPAGSNYLFYASLVLVLAILISPFHLNQLLVFLTATVTTIALVVGKYNYEQDKISKWFLQNKAAVYIGKISFGLYMWHQLIFAFARYAFLKEITPGWSVVLVAMSFVLSVLSYHFIEGPFRNRKKMSFRKVLRPLIIIFILFTGGALYIYMIGGVYKDFPSLDMYTKDNAARGYNFFSPTNNIQIHYNEKIRKLDRPFAKTDKLKILVIGNSYGRDVSNIILESSVSADCELSYFDIVRLKRDSTIKQRWLSADLVFIAARKFIGKNRLEKMARKYHFKINFSKVFCFGTKSFGYSNGINYHKIRRIKDFSDYYTDMKKGFEQTEQELKKEWGSHYISLIGQIENTSHQVLVFTPKGKFISQDTKHLTKAGAKFYAHLLSARLEKMISYGEQLKKKGTNVDAMKVH